MANFVAMPKEYQTETYGDVIIIRLISERRQINSIPFEDKFEINLRLLITNLSSSFSLLKRHLI